MEAGSGIVFEYEKAITRLSSKDGATEFVVTADGNVGIGSWIANERLTIESSKCFVLASPDLLNRR